MKKFLSLVCILSLLAGSIFAQTPGIAPVGTRTLSRAAQGAVGTAGDLQLVGSTINGPIASYSGFNFNGATGALLDDSLPLTNQNNFITVDTTVSDTVILSFGVTNIIVNKWNSTVTGITTLVFVLPVPPSNITSISGNQADNFVTNVKYGPGASNTTAAVIKKRPDTGYLSIYTGVAAKATDTKFYYYVTAASTYY